MSLLRANVEMNQGSFTLDLRCEINAPVTGIFGPSGAGKTSFVRVLAGLAEPDKGSIYIGERLVFSREAGINLPPEQRNVGYVFQEGMLFPHMNVAGNLKYGMQRKYDLSMFKKVTELLKISDILKNRISTISGGQAQRVAIGRALLSAPDLLILDEPFSSLDKNLRYHIISLLKPLIEQLNIPMLVISHDLADLMLLSEELLIIREGTCIGQGNYYDLITKNEALKEFSRSGLLNSIKMQVDYIDGEKGLLIGLSGGMRICAEAFLEHKSFFEIDTIKVFLRPEDVTLALHPIKDISIQNQLEGRIEKIIYQDARVLCVIDHGFKLIAEVTHATVQNMKLAEGKSIWSLFKAAAIKFNTKRFVNSKEL